MTDTRLLLIGLVAPVLFGAVMARLTLWRRRKGFEHAKTHFGMPTYAQLGLPRAERSAAELKLKSAFEEISGIEHCKAKRLQDQCIGFVVGASASLFLAFFATALGVTLMKGLAGWRAFCDALDVSAMAIVLFAFLRVNALRPRWLRARIIAEALRQWGAVDAVFAPPRAFTAELGSFLNEVREIVVGDPDPLVAGQNLAEGRHLALATLLSGPIKTAQLRLYLQARPIGQARWVARSIARLEDHRSRREPIMAALFTFALAAALVKFIVEIVWPSAPELVGDSALLLLLLASGFAAALSSAYFGHNSRSVLHRYRAHERAIMDWFARNIAVFDLARGDAPLVGDATLKAVEAVTEFENLMLSELVDWLSISSTDSMELGLS